jgi:uncharacterized protein
VNTINTHTQETSECCAMESTKQPSFSVRLAEAAVMLIVLTAVYRLLQQSEFSSLAVPTEDVVSLATVFIIGLTASASSCLALVGGLLLSVSARYAEMQGEMTGMKKMAPLLSFNIGRIVGYILFGGLTGLVGQSLILSVKTTGALTIVLSIVMIVLGLKILKLFPKVSCSIPLPRLLWARVQRLSSSGGYSSAFFLGAGTYFVPCGFTQSMQLLALASGSLISGALIMGVFALGTLPALLGISAMSSCAKGKCGRGFLLFAGSMSIFLGILNLEGGLALRGINLDRFLPVIAAEGSANDPSVRIDRNDQQILSVEVHDNGYDRTEFMVEKGKPTWIYASVPQPLAGCTSTMVLPDMNISKPLAKGGNWVGPFTPTKDFAFMCSMGMFRANVRVRG